MTTLVIECVLTYLPDHNGFDPMTASAPGAVYNKVLILFHDLSIVICPAHGPIVHGPVKDLCVE